MAYQWQILRVSPSFELFIKSQSVLSILHPSQAEKHRFFFFFFYRHLERFEPEFGKLLKITAKEIEHSQIFRNSCFFF